MLGPAHSSGSGKLPSLCGRRRECAVLDELLANGLARYDEALAVARHACEDTFTLYISMWALPELGIGSRRELQAALAGPGQQDQPA
jgi:hypothetical protein